MLILAACALGALAQPKTPDLPLSASLEHSQIRIDQTVKLLLVIPRRWASTGPDLTVLEPDFEIVASSPRSELRIVDGEIANSTRWLVELAPRRVGTLTIPPITVHDYVSKPLSLQVLPAQDSQGRSDAAATPPDLYIETGFSPRSPYEQAQIDFVVRLISKVPIMSGTLDEPQPANAVVLRLGTDARYNSSRHGQDYRVLERRYALFAQAPGPLLVPGIHFKGEVAMPDDNATDSSRFGSGRTLRIESVQSALQVRSRPNDRDSRWLPAMRLRLSERWSADPNTLRAGETVTRTIRMEAIGLRAEQLPQLSLQAPPGLQVFPGQVERETRTDRNAVHGTLEQQFALVTRDSGDFQLSAVGVEWWNVQSDRPERAELAPLELRVAAAGPAGGARGEPASPTPPRVARGDDNAAEVRPWQALSASLALLWLLTLYAWHRRRPRDARQRQRAAGRLSAARTDALLACAADAPERVHTALLAWAREAWPLDPPRSVSILAERLEQQHRGADQTAELADALQALERAVFGDNVAWRGERLYALLKQLLTPPPPSTRPRAIQDRSTSALPPLNPGRLPGSGQ
ncbi:MAG: BatD family protein [Gammaproteobacteria bacterium]|nr:BatD family protein [Gammaproteobacteria bacterium]